MMKKRTIIIVGVAIALIAIVIFLFWDEIKLAIAKKKNDFYTEPTDTVIQTNISTGSTNTQTTSSNTTTTSTGTSTASKPPKYSVLKAKEDVPIWQWLASTTPIKTIKAGAPVGIYVGTRDNGSYFNVINGSVDGLVNKNKVSWN